MKELLEESRQYKIGISVAVACQVLWGVLPIYWQSLKPINSSTIIFYRVALSGLLCFVVGLKLYGWKGIWEPIKSKKSLLLFFVTGIIITFNWSVFVWAVNANLIIQACIGYYIEPLVVCIFGIIFFKEKMSGYKLVAFIMACLGLVIILIHFRQLPSVALAIAFSFAIYTALKKSFNLPPILSLFYETVFLLPPAIGVIIYLEAQGEGASPVDIPMQYGLLMLAGFWTVLTLALFSMAANRINMVSLGILGYIAPSISLIIGIFVYNEPFDLVQFLSFVAIWIGLLVFTYGEAKQLMTIGKEG